MDKKKIDHPLLTIHVAVFNLEKYIRQCLDSILTQDFHDYEVILVDNGSTDCSIEICEQYAKKYPNIIKFKKFPLPTMIGRPYTYARAKMRGKYFMAVDGDDYITAGALVRIAAIIESGFPDIIMGTFISDVEVGCRSFTDAIFDSQKINNVTYSEALKYIATLPNFHTVQWRFIVKNEICRVSNDYREIFQVSMHQYGELLNESRYGDLLNILNFLSKAKSLRLMEEPFYMYRCRINSLSAMRVGNEQAVSFLVALITMKAWFSGDKNERIQDLVQSQLHKFCSLYTSVCTTVTEDGYIKMAKLIDQFHTDFVRLREHHIVELTQLCDLVILYGALQGLKKYTKRMENDLFCKIQPWVDKEFYVFPTGSSGESTFILLQRWNLKVKGFLDNDPTKEALKFQGFCCMLPERLKKLSYEQKTNIVVIISMSYEQLAPILKKQLIKLGIQLPQIIVRE